MRIFLISPVRNMTPEVQARVDAYVAGLEADGHVVHYPIRDTDQDDSSGGLRICQDNIRGIRNADAVHVWWDGESEGGKFDLGAAMALDKPIKLANADEVQLPDLPKSFTHVVRALHAEYEDHLAFPEFYECTVPDEPEDTDAASFNYRAHRNSAGEVVFDFGKFNGSPISVVSTDYLRWMLAEGKFTGALLAVVRSELERRLGLMAHYTKPVVTGAAG